jgi:hypothetical protein
MLTSTAHVFDALDEIRERIAQALAGKRRYDLAEADDDLASLIARHQIAAHTDAPDRPAVEVIRAGIGEALDRIADRPPRITQRTKVRLLAAVVVAAAILLALNLAGTAKDLTGHDARPPVTSEYIPTPAGPPAEGS